jgi:hypothetical protein
VWGCGGFSGFYPRLSHSFFCISGKATRYIVEKKTVYKEFLHQKQKEEVEKEEDRDSRGLRPLTPIRFYLIDREQ